MYESAQMAVSLPTWSGIKVVRPGLTHVLAGLEMLKEWRQWKGCKDGLLRNRFKVTGQTSWLLLCRFGHYQQWDWTSEVQPKLLLDLGR